MKGSGENNPSLEGRSVCRDGGGRPRPSPHHGSDFRIEEAAMTAAVAAFFPPSLPETAFSSFLLRLLDVVQFVTVGSDLPS